MNKIIALIILVVTIFSCYEDNSTIATKDLPEVNINTQARDTMNIYFLDTIKIDVEIETSSEELTYEWGIGKCPERSEDFPTTHFDKISSEKSLKYVPRELGHYVVRQIVNNEYGSEIKYYHVFINSPYEEGYFILCRKENGDGSVAFLKTLTPEEIEFGLIPEFRNNVYKKVNEETLLKDPVACRKVGSSVFILTGESQSLIQLNDKTLEETMRYDFKFYKSDFVPSSMSSYDGKYCSDLYCISKNGGCCMVQLREQFVFPFTELPTDITFTEIASRPSYFSSVAKFYIGNFEGGNRNALSWNAEDGTGSFAIREVNGYFRDREIIDVFMSEHHDGNDIFVFNRYNGQIFITGLHRYMVNRGTGEIPWVLFERQLSNSQIIDENTQCLTNDLYKCVSLTHENKVYKWFYNQPDEDLPSQPFITLPEGEEIKCINHYIVSRNEDAYQSVSKSAQTTIYIATYNENREGLKGSLYIYNIETGEQLYKYEGVCNEPVDIMYKIK